MQDTSCLGRDTPPDMFLAWGFSSHCANPWQFLTCQRNIKRCAYNLCRLNHVCVPNKPWQKHGVNLKRRMGLVYVHSETNRVEGACAVKWLQERPHIKKDQFLLGCSARIVQLDFVWRDVCNFYHCRQNCRRLALCKERLMHQTRCLIWNSQSC